MFLDLLRKKPVVLTNSSMDAMSASAKLLASGKRANKAGVTLFTRSSVHCADRIVATSSCTGVE